MKEEIKTEPQTNIEVEQPTEPTSNADKFWQIHYEMYEEKKKNLTKIPVKIEWKDQQKQN